SILPAYQPLVRTSGSGPALSWRGGNARRVPSRPAPKLTRRVGGTYGSSARYGKTGVPSRRAAPGAATSGPPGRSEPRHALCGTGVASFEQPRQVEVGMYYDEEWRALSFVAGLTLGMALGAGVALLMAPQSGR